LPDAPGSSISLCARAASASGNSLPTTGRKVPFSRPAVSAAWISASSVGVMSKGVNARIEARRAMSSRAFIVTPPRLPITMTRPFLAKSFVAGEVNVGEHFENYVYPAIARRFQDFFQISALAVVENLVCSLPLC